ncbi:MAG: DNA-3-methyladenine glycosylase I [Candidatus Lokiarchaeota archaeon]|nr:DNA-3-methyladenine glycosylase I [Candidatus Lokiarchaeota archaeon]
MNINHKSRCFGTGNTLMEKYHDEEWGVPVHNDKELFEFLILEGAQAGLSWSTVLKKRENYRKAFDNWDYLKIAQYNSADIARLLEDKGIIRNRLKIESAIQNARIFKTIQKEFGSFDSYIWGFVEGQPLKHSIADWSESPSKTPLSDQISKDLKKKGMKFVGSTIIYAYLQAIGIVNDHLTSCFRYNQII